MIKRLLLFLITALALISCSEDSNKSAFIGDSRAANTAPVGTLPAESLYSISDSFQTQDNTVITLDHFRGKPTVVGMIFTHCTYACPRLTADIQNIEDSLQNENGKINFLLVSFDHERDNPAQLKKFADSLKLDKNWTLLHGSEASVRTLSILLNVQYEKDGEGNFSHSNIISVLDKEGKLAYQKEGLNANQSATIASIKNMLK
ncbi:MAG: SCO family protein [Bacteroidetes bacterium]|nr:SCO family protein [Bacteroidota bacterium]